MRYRKFLADKIFNGERFLQKGEVMVVDEHKKIVDFVDRNEAGDDVMYLSGILTPGLINSHCHLELSHMEDVIPPGLGLVDFLINVVSKRGTQSDEIILEKAALAEKEMYNNGIQGVGDIANTIHGISVKKQSKIQWYNLIEVLNFYDQTLQERIDHNKAVLQRHKEAYLAGILTPHAPYTVSTSTFKLLNEATKGSVISIHNQETAAEDELFKKGTGDFLRLYKQVGFAESPFLTSGKSSLQTYLPFFTQGQTLILVHNTFINEEDILFAKSYAATHGLRLAFCLCPNANLYIENKLPPVDLLVKNNCTLLLGTDSYSSNWQLSIASELAVIQKNFPSLPLETILKWATSNGTTIFGWETLGVLKTGTYPGLALIETDKDGILTGKSKRII